MTSLALPTSANADVTTMARIEARRLARHPVFLIGVVLAFGVLALLYLLTDGPYFIDALATPVVPAFFIGLTSLVAMARLTRSTEAAAEAVGTAPGSQARRTTALALACLVPFAAGLVWTAVLLVMTLVRSPAPQEWWFSTLPDWQVWSILLALGPIACLGGGLLGVLTGRWLRFPGAAAVVVVVVVAVDMVAQLGYVYGERSELRLWLPWAMFQSGTFTDGTQTLVAGNPALYAAYLLCLCALAALGAVWRDRTARTGRLRAVVVAVIVAALACVALAMTTSHTDNRISEPIPSKVQE